MTLMLMHFCITTVSPASFQDSVINLERNPNHPLYKFDEVFHTPAFVDKYAKDLRDHMQRGQQENLVPRTVQEIVPDVAHGMNGLNDGMSTLQTSQTQVSTAARGLAYLDENDVAAPSIKQDAPHSDEW